MSGPEVTLAAAIVAAGVASLGLIWSVVSFFITRQATEAIAARSEAIAARSEWRSRFDQAHALALGLDSNEARSGASLMKSLSNEEWVTDSDRATTASVLLGLPAEVSQTAEVSQAAEVSEVLSTFEDKSAAALLGNVQQGPKARYQLYQDKKGAWRWSLRAASGEVIAISGTFESKAIALDGFPYFRGTAE